MIYFQVSSTCVPTECMNAQETPNHAELVLNGTRQPGGSIQVVKVSYLHFTLVSVWGDGQGGWVGSDLCCWCWCPLAVAGVGLGSTLSYLAVIHRTWNDSNHLGEFQARLR